MTARNSDSGRPTWLFCLVTCTAASAMPMAFLATTFGVDLPHTLWGLCALLLIQAMSVTAHTSRDRGLVGTCIKAIIESFQDRRSDTR
jgi:hypothetical protein